MIITRRMLPTQKGDLWIVSRSKTILEKFVDTIKKVPFGFTVGPADPCMLFKETNLGICIIIMYVDDILIIGKKEQIQEFATMIQKEIYVKIQYNLVDYLGCEFHNEQRENKRMAGSTLNNQKTRTKILRNSYEGKVFNDTWDSKIHCQKTGKQT